MRCQNRRAQLHGVSWLHSLVISSAGIKECQNDSWNVGFLSPAALFAPLYHAYHLKWSLFGKWLLLEWHFVHCGLSGEFPGWTASLARKSQGQGSGFVEEFWGGKWNCFDWPSCYSSFESTGLFSWILFNRSWGLILNTHSPEMAESFLTASKWQTTRCFSAS